MEGWWSLPISGVPDLAEGGFQVDRRKGPLLECGHLVRVSRQGGSDFLQGCQQQ